MKKLLVSVILAASGGAAYAHAGHSELSHGLSHALSTPRHAAYVLVLIWLGLGVATALRAWRRQRSKAGTRR